MILFLDFDGVLHLEFLPGSTPGKVRANTEYWTHLPRIETVLREFPTIDVVVSSAWRLRHSLAELRELFSPDIARRIIGETPALGMKESDRREKEIRLWLKEAGRQNESFIAIDDWAPLFSDGWPHLFWVSPETAFDDEAAARLRVRLNREMGRS